MFFVQTWPACPTLKIKRAVRAFMAKREPVWNSNFFQKT